MAPSPTQAEQQAPAEGIAEENGYSPPQEAVSAGAEGAPGVPAEASRESRLQEEIDRLQEENGKLRDQWVRAVAETENLRKRNLRDQEDITRYAVTGFARDMVSVLENLSRARENIPAEARAGSDLLKTLGEGIDLTVKELLNIFTKYGIVRIDPMNQKFDHNLHQAVVQVERHDLPPGTVVQVVQAGYVIHDRLLRPAMVAVSKQAEPAKKVDTTA